jgi:pyruvate oxidase
MSSRTVAQALIGLLETAGVDTIYGVTGDAVFPFFDALAKQQGRIRFIGTTTEMCAAFMASYHAKLTGRIGVCVATAGPGAASLVNGLSDAYFDRAPVLAITGQVALNKLGTGAKQEVNQQLLFQALTTSSQLVTSGEAALSVIARAIQEALWQQTVTHVSIPEDVFHHAVPSSAPVINPQALSGCGGGVTGNLDDAMCSLASAKQPMIVVGIRDPSLRELVESLADAIGAAIVLAQQAKGFLPDDHCRVLGGIGEAYIPAILDEVDRILQIGNTPFEMKYFPSTVGMVQLVPPTGTIDHGRTNQALVGNVRDSVQALVEGVKLTENPKWQEKIAREKEKRDRMIDEQRRNRAQPIHPAHLMTVLSDLVPPDAVIVCDIGSYVHWFDSYFKAQEQTVMISPHWRSLGAGLPGALAAVLQQPGKKVLALVGDGGLMPVLGEICTAVKHQVPVAIVVANNHHYEIEQVRMEHQGLTPFGVDISVPDYAALAASCGAEGRKATTSDELYAMLQESLACTGPTVLDVQVAQAGLPFLNAK